MSGHLEDTVTSIDDAALPRACNERLHGLDLLKTVMLVGVFSIHSTLFYYRADAPFAGMNGWVWLFDAYILFVSSAVPALLAISLYLFLARRLHDAGYFRTRIVRLLVIVGFWWPVYAVVGPVVGYRGFTHDIVGVLTMPLTDGGLYFLGTVVLLTVWLELLIRMRRPGQHKLWMLTAYASLVVAHTIVIAAFALLPAHPAHVRKLIDLGPLMFVPLAPAVLLIVSSKCRARALAVVVSTAVMFEVVFGLVSGSLIDMLSGVPGNYFVMSYVHPLSTGVASSLLVLALRCNRKPPVWVSTVARYSLGAYLVHILVYPVVAALLARSPVHVAGGVVSFNPLVFVGVTGITIVLLMILARTPLTRFIR